MFRKGYPGTEAGPKALAAEMDMVRDQPAEVLQTGAGDNPLPNARDMPGYYHTTNTADDTMMRYRIAAANDGKLNAETAAALRLPEGMQGDPAAMELLRHFKVNLTQKDIDFFEDRFKTAEKVRFDDWLTQVIDISDPGESRWLQDLYPEFWNRREKYIDDEINTEAALAKIRLRGIKNMSDLKLIYAMETGRWSPATAPLWSHSPAGGSNFRTGWLSLAGPFNGRERPELRRTYGNLDAYKANPITAASGRTSAFP
jgi:hypothetical protein